jgi:hypothetical protein
LRIKNELDIIQLVEKDKWMMEILEAASLLYLPDWWVCAGFVRSKIWDTLHGFNNRTEISDIDVIYFDPTNVEKGEEKRLEAKLHEILPTVPWSVKNEARMHINNGIPPYTSSVDAISKFPETATALGLRLDEQGSVVLTAPVGIKDVINLEVKPTPYFLENEDLIYIYEKRLSQKNWPSIWNRVRVYHIQHNNGEVK